MKISTKIRYGLRTMIEIASSKEPYGVLQKDIAKNQNISLKYLDPIISSLKLKGLIINSKGRGSGYLLARPVEKITVFDIYIAFETIEVVECINNCGFSERLTHNCSARNYWGEFQVEFCNILKKKNLAQIVNETYYECNRLVKS